MGETLLHETLHSCNLAFDPESMLTEAQVTTLSVVLADVLARNKKFRDELIGLLTQGR